MYQAERPLLVTNATASVLNSTDTTAPGQKLRSSGTGAMNRLSSTRTGATNSAICAELPSAIPTQRSTRFWRAAVQAVVISAAAPTIATTTNPTNAGVMPNVNAACCTDPTKISLTSATSTVTTTSKVVATPMGQTDSPSPPSCAAPANNSRCVRKEKNRP